MNDINKIIYKLKENKVITNDDLLNKDKGEIVSEYINEDKTIDFNKLVSFQYTNRAIVANDDQKFSKCKILYGKDLYSKFYKNSIEENCMFTFHYSI